jgi:hypothetical protein
MNAKNSVGSRVKITRDIPTVTKKVDVLLDWLIVVLELFVLWKEA